MSDPSVDKTTIHVQGSGPARHDPPPYLRADVDVSTLPRSLQNARQAYLDAHGRLP